jgi:Rrf2 family protein
MIISSRHDVALAFLIQLAGENKSVAKIAHNTGSSLSNMEHTATVLRHAGLITSIRGKTGGYALTRSLEQITVGDIFDAVGTETKRRGYGLFDEIHRRLKDVAVSDLLARRSCIK